MLTRLHTLQIPTSRKPTLSSTHLIDIGRIYCKLNHHNMALEVYKIDLFQDIPQSVGKLVSV